MKHLPINKSSTEKINVVTLGCPKNIVAFQMIGVRQPSMFPQASTTTRQHKLFTATANAMGHLWCEVIPSCVTGITATCRYDNGALASDNVLTGWTDVMTIPSATATHPLWKSNYRVVSAGVRAWLTTPFINSTGQFLGTVINSGQLNLIAPADMYDYMGDTPSRTIA